MKPSNIPWYFRLCTVNTVLMLSYPFTQWYISRKNTGDRAVCQSLQWSTSGMKSRYWMHSHTALAKNAIRSPSSKKP